MTDPKTIAVVGGGSAGLTAATTAASRGARVVLFLGDDPEKASLCVNRGCMPSKALFQPIDDLHRARRWGLPGPDDPDRFLSRIVDWKDREIARFRAYRQKAIRDRAGDDFLVVRNAARFVDPHTLEAQGERYEADAVILATGSTPIFPPIDGLDDLADEVWTSADMLANRALPESLVVIGAGAIGLELSLRYSRLGCPTTVVSHTRVLPRFPARFGERLAEIYEGEGVRMLPERTVLRIRRDIEGWLVCHTEGEEGSEPLVAERVLLATGRRPALDGLDLEAGGIEPSEDGGLAVGDDLRVAGTDHVFAAGDVGGMRMVVHHAHIEAGIAAENAVDDADRTWPKRANIEVVFSDPEFAWAGVSHAEAEASGHATVTASKESRLVGKLHLAGDDHGFGEFVADADSHCLLGAGLLCDDASNLIHLPAYMIEHQHEVHETGVAEFYHPTKSEILSSILDRLCQELDGSPFERAPE